MPILPLNCLDNLRLLERARLVVVDHLKYLSRGLRAAPSVTRQCRHGRQRASADVREGFGRVGVLHRWRLGAAVRLRRLRKGFGRRGRAFKNSRLNSSSAFSAARWRRSRSSASCARRFFRPRWMADSLCASGVMLLRRGDDASMASRRRHVPSTRPRESLYVITDAAKRATPRCRFPPSRPRRAPPAPS